MYSSGFWKTHSTETALVSVVNDILMKTDAGECSVLVLLDFNTAFDMVHHSIIVKRLRTWVGISRTALQWLPSYSSNRKCVVSVYGFISSKALSMYVVPQGFILGPILFSLYLLPLGNIIKKHDISFHTDDTPLYLSCKPSELSYLHCIIGYL